MPSDRSIVLDAIVRLRTFRPFLERAVLAALPIIEEAEPEIFALGSGEADLLKRASRRIRTEIR